jgi:predicted ATPase
VSRRRSKYHVLDQHHVHALKLISLNHAHQAYLYTLLGVNATNDSRHSEAAGYFTQAISLLNSNPSLSTAVIADLYEDLVVVS